MAAYPEKEKYTAEDLVQIIMLLRDPEAGCPWDKVQTHTSIRKNFLEETYEALEAIDADDPAMMREELGDVMMQVVFHCVMEAEKQNFTFTDVCDEVCRKLIYRHPHIFGTPEQQQNGIMDWDALKNKEKGRRSLADEINTVPKTFPALMKAQKLQKRAQPYGCVCGEQETAGHQAQAAQQALAEQLVQGADEAQVRTKAGEYLFQAVNWVRSAGMDAEEVLSLYNDRFAQECVAKEASKQAQA